MVDGGFGNGVGLAAARKSGFLLASKVCHGNPYDGHTLKEAMEQVNRVRGRMPEHGYADMAYRAHNYEGGSQANSLSDIRPSSVFLMLSRRFALHPGVVAAGQCLEWARVLPCLPVQVGSPDDDKQSRP